MAPVFVQVPGLSDEDIPPDKCKRGVVVLEVKSLSANGGINLNSTSV